MTKDRDKQIRRNLHAILDAASDLLFEVGVPETGDDSYRLLDPEQIAADPIGRPPPE